MHHLFEVGSHQVLGGRGWPSLHKVLSWTPIAVIHLSPVLHGNSLSAVGGTWTIAVPFVMAAVWLIGRQHLVHCPSFCHGAPAGALLRGAAVSIPGFRPWFFFP